VTPAVLAPSGLTSEPALGRAWWAVKDTLVLAKRSIARIAREPEQLMDVTIQPVIFILLFAYVFGSAIRLPGGGSYHQYLISGMFGMSMAGTASGTAVGLCADMSTGLIDRFRALPISRAAMLAGRALSDLATQALGVLVLVGVQRVSVAAINKIVNRGVQPLRIGAADQKRRSLFGSWHIARVTDDRAGSSRPTFSRGSFFHSP